MKRYLLILLTLIFSGLAVVNAQSYRTLYSSTTINGTQGNLKEDKNGRITIDLKRKTITTRVKSGFLKYEKEYEVKFIIDSVKKEKSASGTIIVYSCHYATDNKAFVTITDSFNADKNRREVSFLNDNNVQRYVVR
jgi:hypothetical protein